MTYPPQQPGQPGPYGQQPDPYGQQPGQFGQQQQPPPGQFGQQPGQFGPPGAPPGPDGGYGYPGGPQSPPPKKRSGLVIALVIVGAILVLGGGGTGVYFLTKGKDNSSNNSQGGGGGAPSSGPQIKPTGPKLGTGSPSSIGGLPFPSGGSSGSGSAAPPKSGTVGGPGGPLNGSDEAAITDAAKRYATAVTNKDEAGAKDLTCDKTDGGILYDSGGKVEVTGKPESFGSDSASIDVKVTIGDSEPIDNFPLFMNKKGSGWCVS
jgi:hypothetical protein